MATPENGSKNTSRDGSPAIAQASRFTSQASTAEDLLKSQTVGLVNLSDFRKRRAEALEQKEKEAANKNLDQAYASEGAELSSGSSKKKRKKVRPKGKLSFAPDDGDEDDDASRDQGFEGGNSEANPVANGSEAKAKRFGANKNIAAPKIMTKSALLKEASAREGLRKEFLALQEAVKATEIAIPFVFYDGTNIPGGMCRVKKGDPVWVFLDRCRKVGAELGVGGSGEKSNTRREWARVGVDDLMLVKGEIIIPHHYEFYYFIVNKTVGYSGELLFPFSTEASQQRVTEEVKSGLSMPGQGPSANESKKAVEELEGADGDPLLTKVVDRRWYEKNKHIFPASVWEDFDSSKDYTKSHRKDAEDAFTD